MSSTGLMSIQGHLDKTYAFAKDTNKIFVDRGLRTCCKIFYFKCQ